MTEELAGSRGQACAQSLPKPPAVPEPLFPFDLKTAARLEAQSWNKQGRKMSQETAYF